MFKKLGSLLPEFEIKATSEAWWFQRFDKDKKKDFMIVIKKEPGFPKTNDYAKLLAEMVNKEWDNRNV